MQYLTKISNLDAVYYFSNLFKALETLKSESLMKFLEIFSFFRNLHYEI